MPFQLVKRRAGAPAAGQKRVAVVVGRSDGRRKSSRPSRALTSGKASDTASHQNKREKRDERVVKSRGEKGKRNLRRRKNDDETTLETKQKVSAAVAVVVVSMRPLARLL